MRGGAVALTAVLVMAGCGGGADQQEGGIDRIQADSTALAAEQFDAAIFDTITWNGDTAAVNRGRTVYAFSCRKCHGNTGMGDAGFVLRGDTLKPPSFLTPDWKYANDPVGLRKVIYSGNAKGMPHWGLEERFHTRDIDAVAHYIVEDMRAGVDTAKSM